MPLRKKHDKLWHYPLTILKASPSFHIFLIQMIFEQKHLFLTEKVAASLFSDTRYSIASWFFKDGQTSSVFLYIFAQLIKPTHTHRQTAPLSTGASMHPTVKRLCTTKSANLWLCELIEWRCCLSIFYNCTHWLLCTDVPMTSVHYKWYIFFVSFFFEKGTTHFVPCQIINFIWK